MQAAYYSIHPIADEDRQALKTDTANPGSGRNIADIGLTSILLGDFVEDFTELIQRLLAIQSAGRDKSLQGLAADKRLIDNWQGKSWSGNPQQTSNLS